MIKTCQHLGLTDDVAIGMIVTVLLRVPYVESFLFHIPFEKNPILEYNISSFRKQVKMLF